MNSSKNISMPDIDLTCAYLQLEAIFSIQNHQPHSPVFLLIIVCIFKFNLNFIPNFKYKILTPFQQLSQPH